MAGRNETHASSTGHRSVVHHSLRDVRAGVLAVMELVEVSALVTRAEAAEIAKMAEMMGVSSR